MRELTRDPGTAREFYLHFPDDVLRHDHLMLVLNLHGARSSARWQDGYFPACRIVDKYRLVVATPALTKAQLTSVQVADAEDELLRNIVETVLRRFGWERIASFWLAGHSRGGFVCYRLLRTSYFATKVDGWLSLSGGRLGWPESVARGAAAVRAAKVPGRRDPARRQLLLPDADFSFIYSVGEHEIESLPPSSPLAERYAAGARQLVDVVVDDQPGCVYDPYGRGSTPAWGGRPRPGTAQIYVYPGARDGRLIADVVRVGKGHTEGLEPRITEELVKLMAAAPTGKLRGSWPADASGDPAVRSRG